MRPYVSNAACYVAASLVSGLAGVLVFPVLSSEITSAELVQLGIIEPVLLLLAQVTLLGGNFAVFEVARLAREALPAVARAWLPKLLPTYFGLLVLALLVSRAAEIKSALALSVWLAVGAEAAYLLLLSVARARSFGGDVLRAACIRASTWLVGCAVASRLFHLELVDVLLIKTASTAVAALALRGRTTGRDTHVPLGRREAVRYGLPITLAAGVTPLVEVAERAIVASTVSIEAAASYVVAAKYLSVLNLGVLSPLGLWWPTERVRLRSLPDGGSRYFTRIHIAVPVLTGLVAVPFLALAPVLIPLLAPGQVPPDQALLALLTAGSLLRAWGPVLGVAAMDPGRTWIAPVSASVSMFVTAVVGSYLTASHGVMGMAITVLIASALNASAYIGLARHAAPIGSPVAGGMVGLSFVSLALASVLTISL